MKKTVKDVNEAMGVKEYKPEITLDEKIYPDLKDLKVDDVVDLSVKFKVTSVSKSQYDTSDKLQVRGTIENAESESGEADD